MIGALQHARRTPGLGKARLAFWDFSSGSCAVVLSLLYRYRVEGLEHVPRTGPAIFIANHQSLLDPVIHGMAVTYRAPRPMAKESLFRNPALGAILRGLGCISVREDGGSNRDSMRAALEELAANRCVMIYPEGTRSPDGEVKPFQRGIELLVRKSGAPVVPMGIDGAFDIWPTGRRLPRLRGRIWTTIGEPIGADELARLFADPARGLDALRDRVDALVQRCRSRLSGGSAEAGESRGAWLS